MVRETRTTKIELPKLINIINNLQSVISSAEITKA